MSEDKCDQHVIPEATPGVSQYEFVDWHTAQAAQRARLEIARSIAAAEILHQQMAWKRDEIARSMYDLSKSIASAAQRYAALARDLAAAVEER